MSEQFRPGGRPERAPAADVPFFAPSRGEFDAAPSGFGSAPAAQFGSAPAAQFGSAPAARFGAPAAGFGARPVPAQDHRVPGLEDVAGLGQAAVVLAVVVAAADLVSSLGGLTAEDSLVGGLVTVAATAAYFAALVANLVVVGLWLGRARRNAHRIEPRFPQRRAAVWAWFGWFVPIAFLFVPFQYVTDVWTASKRRAPHGTSPRLGLWWGLWLASALLGNLSFRMSMDGDYGTAAGVALVSSLFTVAALPLFRGVVRSITAAQRP